MALFVDELTAEARSIQAEIERIRRARRRCPLRDYTNRAVLLVQQRRLERELSDVRRAARQRRYRG